LSVIVNTADDENFYGLHVSPDLDTTVYNLAGAAPRDRGWGIAGDSQRTLSALQRFYRRGWFALGDRDLATHIYRTHALASGRCLHEVTAAIARAFGIRAHVLPMSNDPVRTFVHTRRGLRLPFQEYFVRRRARDPVARLSYRGLGAARPTPGVLEAIRHADLLLLPPSNPFTSIRPILGVGGVERALRERRAPLVAVSPVAAGRAVRGPLGGMLRAAGYSVSPVSIAAVYRGLLDGMVIDSTDAALRAELERKGIAVVAADIRMDTMARSLSVARTTLELGRRLRKRMA
ncbi:MAG TPA: 2-phospho-L-lactate transferase CofD family protein, partial [Candidatus Binatia bacterium]|nr:2-phospho-L-lactate transferase CofD family protein [Candidatus Binatia bacterium]